MEDVLVKRAEMGATEAERPANERRAKMDAAEVAPAEERERLAKEECKRLKKEREAILKAGEV